MYKVKILETVAAEFDTMYSKEVIGEVWYVHIARYKAIVLRSIENIDTLFSLYDMTDEDNIKASEWFTQIIKEHFTFIYNRKTPADKAFDIELNYIQGYCHKIAEQLTADGLLSLLPSDVVKSYGEYADILEKQRFILKAEKEAYEEEYAKAQAEIEAKQKALDEENSKEDIDSIPEADGTIKEDINKI